MSATHRHSDDASKRRKSMIRRVLTSHRKQSVDSAMGALYEDVEKFFGDIFALYGRAVVRRPLPFVLAPLVVCVGFALGLLTASRDTNLQAYTPSDAQALQDFSTLRHNFPDSDLDSNYFYYKDVQERPFVEVIISVDWKQQSRVCSSVNDTWTALESELLRVLSPLQANVSCSSDVIVSFEEVCAKRQGSCVALISENFARVLRARRCGRLASEVARSIDLVAFHDEERFVVGETNEAGDEESEVGAPGQDLWLKIAFRRDAEHLPRSHCFEKQLHAALARATAQRNDSEKNLLEIHVTSSQSSLNELSRSDAHLFLFSVLLMTIYCLVIGLGCNWVSNYLLASVAGVCSVLLSLVAAFGFLSICGVPILNTSALVAFLILGKSLRAILPRYVTSQPAFQRIPLRIL